MEENFKNEQSRYATKWALILTPFLTALVLGGGYGISNYLLNSTPNLKSEITHQKLKKCPDQNSNHPRLNQLFTPCPPRVVADPEQTARTQYAKNNNINFR